MTILELFGYSQHISTLGSVLIAASCLYRLKLRNPFIQILGLYALTALLFTAFQSISTGFFKNAGINAIGSTYVFFEAILLGLFYSAIAENQSAKKKIFILIFLYIIFYAITVLFFQENYYSMVRWSRDLLMIILSLGYFYSLLKNQPEEKLSNSPLFYINVGILFFFSGTLFLSFLIDYMHRTLGYNSTGFWAFRNFFRFGFCLVMAYACWLDLKLLKQH
jgi:hypothetical protein